MGLAFIPAARIRRRKMCAAEARLELQREGFTFNRLLPGLPWQHMLFFNK